MSHLPSDSDRSRILAWGMYDWANSAFATVVLAGFFPLLFQDYWSAAASDATASLRLGWANAAGSLLIALSAPLLGAVADHSGGKKRFLAVFMAAGVLATISLAWVPQGAWLVAAVLFSCAGVGFMGANVFYDALLVTVAAPGRRHAVSGFGYGLGYLGGGLLYLGCVIAAVWPGALGFESSTQAALAAFVATGVWWAVFAVPLFRKVPEPAALESGAQRAWYRGWTQVITTFGEIRRHRDIVVFLVAYWLYIDAVGTVIRMAVTYGRSLGFGREDLIIALLVVQFVGFPAAIAYGWLGQRFGAKRGIYLGLAAYVGICVWGVFLQSSIGFYGIAVLVGLFQGGVQSLSRSYYAGLIPVKRSSEFFAFYNVLGKFAAVIGPPLFGLFGAWFGDVRYSMLALILLFAAGLLLLSRVDERGVSQSGAPAGSAR